jgi:hypothetical protein
MISYQRNRYDVFGVLLVSIVLGTGGVCMSAPQTNSFRHWRALDNQRSRDWRASDGLPDDIDVPSDK